MSEEKLATEEERSNYWDDVVPIWQVLVSRACCRCQSAVRTTIWAKEVLCLGIGLCLSVCFVRSTEPIARTPTGMHDDLDYPPTTTYYIRIFSLYCFFALALSLFTAFLR